MGKKTFSSRLAEKSQKLEPEINNNHSEKTDTETENPSLEKVEPQQSNSKTYSKKKAAKQTPAPAKVRRSERLQTAVLTTENRDVERIFEEITVSESEKEDDPVDEELPKYVPTSDEKTVHEKFNYIVHLLEAQKMTMDELSSRPIGKSFFSEGSSLGDFTYKGLYIDSQKKVEALLTENYELNKRLENALGKIEVYEKGYHVTSEVLEKLKDVFLFSSLNRATGAISSAARDPPENGNSAKRKRLDKET